MLKIFKRMLAYIIDMMVVLIIVQTISSIPMINKNLDKYNKVYNNYLESFEVYGSFKIDLDKYYEDDKLSEKEYDKLIEEYPTYQSDLDKYYKDNKLTEKNYKKLTTKIDEEYLNNYKKTYYKIDKYSIIYNISYIIVTILYFVFFNIITDGVTLGKKLTRLKIVNNKDSREKVSPISYLIRSIMLYQILYYLIKVIFINILNPSDYYTLSNIFYDIHSYLIFIIITFTIVRLDGRGLHDILSNTKVIELDRNGNEKIRTTIIK